jgi:hypothetical protein
MKKLIALETIVVFFTVVVVLVSIPSLPSTPVIKRETLSSGQMSFLNITLKNGQTVTGSLNFTGGSAPSTTGFEIYNPDNATIIHSQTVLHKGNFTFTANIDGYYTFDVLYSDIENTNYVNYEYSISSPIFGLNPIAFIALVIALGLISTLIVAFLNLRNKKVPCVP